MKIKVLMSHVPNGTNMIHNLWHIDTYEELSSMIWLCVVQLNIKQKVILIFRPHKMADLHSVTQSIARGRLKKWFQIILQSDRLWERSVQVIKPLIH